MAYFYMLARKRTGTLYYGSTIDLSRRIYEHKTHVREGFTNRYDVTRLVYYEAYESLMDVRFREYKIKNGGVPGRSP